MKNGDFFSLSQMQTLTNQSPIAPKTFIYLDSAKRGNLTPSGWNGSRLDSPLCESQADIAHRKHVPGH